MKNETGYSPGHPWYYKLGGAVYKPKSILAAVKKSEYQGYKRDEIHQADNRRESLIYLIKQAACLLPT